MRFITEFENDGTKFDDAITDHRKEWRQNELGKLIADAFGWKERRPTILSNPDAERHTLEIEAFPMDKWIEFKKNLLSEFCGLKVEQNIISKLINELESFGKPSGDAITNLRDLEYRGPDSHCKACDDEKSGIKHIKAPKHTCRK